MSGVRFRRAKSSDKVVDLETFNSMQEWLERVCNMATDQYLNLSKIGTFTLSFRGTTTTASLPFTVTSLSGTQAVVKGGRWRIPGKAIVSVNNTTLTLSGQYEYIYARLLKTLASGDITHSAVEPALDDGTYYNWMLAKYNAVGTGSYSLDTQYYAGGDIQVIAPLL